MRIPHTHTLRQTTSATPTLLTQALSPVPSPYACRLLSLLFANPPSHVLAALLQAYARSVVGDMLESFLSVEEAFTAARR